MTQPIDIDRLSEAELVALNHRIVARLKVIREVRTHASMLAFHIGERVAFDPPGRETQFGVITRYNRKSVTVIAEGSGHWTVAPMYLRKLASPASATAAQATATATRATPPAWVRGGGEVDDLDDHVVIGFEMQSPRLPGT